MTANNAINSKQGLSPTDSPTFLNLNVTGTVTQLGNTYFESGGFNPSSYSTGTVACVDNGITGSGTTFSSAMLGGILEFTSGPSSGESSIIVGFTNSTTIEVFDTFTVSAGTTYIIHYGNISFANDVISYSNNTLIYGSPQYQAVQYFYDGINLPLSSNQIISGVSHTTTLNMPDPAANRVYSIRDLGADGDIVVVPTAATTGQIVYADSATTFSTSTTLPSGVQDNITRTGTVTSGTWKSTVNPAVTDVTSGSQTVAAGGRYWSDKVTLTTFTLPTSPTIGDMYIIYGLGSGGWTVVYGSGQSVNFGSSTTTTTSGSISSSNQYDAVQIIAFSTTQFIAHAIQGNLTVV